MHNSLNENDESSRAFIHSDNAAVKTIQLLSVSLMPRYMSQPDGPSCGPTRRPVG